MATGRPSGFEIVTRATLQVKDRSIYPPDRVVAPYHVVNDAGEVVVVEGTWGDYLRDVDMRIVVKQRAPLNEAEKTHGEVIIQDFFPEGIPDSPFIPDPMLPY